MTNLAFIIGFIGNIRGFQLIIIILVVLLLFGGKKIPELMRNMGKGVNAFKQGLADAKEEINKPIEKDSDKKQDKGDAPGTPDNR